MTTTQDSNSGTTMLYTFERPISFLDADEALSVRFDAPVSVTMEAILSAGDEDIVVAAHEFDPPPGRVFDRIEYRLPVPSGSRISAVRISWPDESDGDVSPAVVSWGTKDALIGYKPDLTDDAVITGTGADIAVRQGNPSTNYGVDLRRMSGLSDEMGAQLVVDLHYSFPQQELFTVGLSKEEAITISWNGTTGGTKKWLLNPRSGRNTVHLYEASNGFSASSLDIEIENEDFAVEGIELRIVNDDGYGLLSPLPADLGSIIVYENSFWRSDEFELFSWNLYPEVLLIDLRDYALQSRFFKRLAFFVEKEGSIGRLLPNDVLQNLHGWNAHDYWAEDLARFYRTADITGFVLNREEEYLRELLYEHGILIRSNPVKAGNGAILSLSKESSDYLRRIFINHEGYHGLYFASPGYRQAVSEIWQALSKDEQEFWRYFLAWKKYDTSNEELVMNEFQAYLMQQATPLVDGYFIEYNIPRMASFLGENALYVDSIVERYPDMFRRAAELVENAAYRETGVMAFDLLDLTPIE